MKKLFTFKNCLIVLLLLAVIAYIGADAALKFESYQIYAEWITTTNDTLYIKSYSALKNAFLFSTIANAVTIACITAFIILFCIAQFKTFKYLKFSAITFGFTSFNLYMSQYVAYNLIAFTYRSILLGYGIITSSFALGLTALIAMLISIACYMYLLVKEIQKRKAIIAQAETQTTESIVEDSSLQQLQEPIVEPSSLEQLDPTIKQDTTQE